ncbi:hypothetical protein ACH492_06740 [Streptomyces sp. NPDC019443]|uniref:hypothetical protein n=1 Tax=Streptomyces sp. NPDC019443 TaxID=3365061 RepID=UPI00379160BC
METQDTQALEPVPQPAQELAALPVPTAAPAPEPVAEGEPVSRPARRRGRTALIVAAAAVIGLVGGTAVGYGVQADREPTPLPALSRADVAYPAKPLPENKRPAPLSAGEDRKVKTDGDLRRLLLAKPSGARKTDMWSGDAGWVDTASYVLVFESEAYMFETLVESDIRRVAAVAWQQGEFKKTNIRLVQFRSGEGARDHAEGQHDYMPEAEDGAGNEGDALKGSGNGRYYLYKVHEKAGYLPLYRARAIFQRGDIMVDINIFDTKRISKSDIRTLAERQLERL